MGNGRKVAVLVYDRLCLFEFAMVMEVLGARPPSAGAGWYEISVGSCEPAPVRTDRGMRIEVVSGPRVFEEADTIIIPAWRMGEVPPGIIGVVTAAAQRGARLVSICTGAFVLAAAGVLEGREATTHWRFAAAFATAFPEVDFQPNRLYTDDGKVMTSAGSSAGMDLLFHMIRQDFGARRSNEVARMMVAPPHRQGGQAQYIETAVPEEPDNRFQRLYDQVRENPLLDYTVTGMAALAGMSERTFFRHFKKATGHSPLDWLLYERIRLAKEMLELTGNSIDRIAYEAGFGAGDTLRHHFRRIVGISPRDYRKSFRHPAAAE